MRKVVVFNLTSLDGYSTGPGNDVSAVVPMMGGAFDSYTAELLRATDTFLVGRRSFEMFNNYWPEVAETRESGDWTAEQKEVSEAGESLPTIVVSDTLNGSWPDTRIIRHADAHREISELKADTGKDILVTGSRTLWNDLLVHGLVDELHVMIGSHVLGEGVPLFTVPPPPGTLHLADVRTWPDSDNILARYDVRGQPDGGGGQPT